MYDPVYFTMEGSKLAGKLISWILFNNFNSELLRNSCS